MATVMVIQRFLQRTASAHERCVDPSSTTAAVGIEDESKHDSGAHQFHHGAGATDVSGELTKSIVEIANIAKEQLGMGVTSIVVDGRTVSSQDGLNLVVNDWKSNMHDREVSMLTRHLKNQYERVMGAIEAGDTSAQLTAARVAWEFATRRDFHDVFSGRFAQVPTCKQARANRFRHSRVVADHCGAHGSWRARTRSPGCGRLSSPVGRCQAQQEVCRGAQHSTGRHVSVVVSGRRQCDTSERQ